MQKKSDILREYDEIIKSQLKQGVIKKCQQEDTPIPYLPHRAVIRNKTSTKLKNSVRC